MDLNSPEEIKASADKQFGAHLYNTKTSTQKVARYGRNNGSIAVELKGEKAGFWYDFSTQEGGVIGFKSFETIFPYKEGFVSRTATKQIRPYSRQNSKWVSKLPEGGFSLFNIENLKPESDVLLVEGEKTCLAAAKIFPNLSVLSWQGGCNGIDKADFSILKKKKVFIWPDADKAGRDCIPRLCDKLLGSASEIYTVDVTDIERVSEHWDIADTPPFPIDFNERLKTAHQIKNVSISDCMKSLSDIASKQYPEVKWVIKGILPQGVALLAGAPKIGKSWLALTWAYEAAEEGNNVLYMALEDSEKRLQDRLRASNREPHKNINVFAAYSHNLIVPNGHDMIAHLETILHQDLSPKLIIIDTLKCVMTSNKFGEKGYDQWVDELRPWVKLAHEYAICILFVHHTRKSNNEEDQASFERILGSQGILSTVDTAIILSKVSGSKNMEAHVTGKDVLEHSLLYEWSYPGFLRAIDSKEAKLGPLQLKILEIIKKMPMCTQTDIIKESSHAKSTVSETVSKLIEYGLVKKTGEKNNLLVSVEADTNPTNSQNLLNC